MKGGREEQDRVDMLIPNTREATSSGAHSNNCEAKYAAAFVLGRQE